MKTRIVFGTLMIAGITALLWWDYHLQAAGRTPVGWPLGALTALLVLAGYHELRRLLAQAGVPMLGLTGALLTLAVALLPLWWQALSHRFAADAGVMLTALGLAVGAAFFLQMLRYRLSEAIRRLAGTLLGVTYLGALAACVLQLRVRFGLPAWVLFLASVKFTDIGAYFVGSAIGKHKLIPWLSPGKSWEGLAGGLVTAAGVAMLLNLLFGSLLKTGLIIPLLESAALGALLGLTGQFGDLCESLLKRDAKVKDSGAIVPGFGGVLDIVDSPLVAAPVGYLLLLAWAN